MLNYDQLFSETRIDLRSPLRHAPGEDFLMQRAGDIAQKMMAQLQNSAISWSQLTKDIVFNPATQPTAVPVWSSIETQGKIRLVHALADDGTIISERATPVVDVESLHEFWSGSRTGQSADCLVLAFEQQQKRWTLTAYPPPANTTTYRLWITKGEIDPPTRSGVPLSQVPEFHRYLRIQLAYAAASYCDWAGLDQKSRGNQIAELKQSLGELKAEYANEWKLFIQNNKAPMNNQPTFPAYWEDMR